MKKRETSPVAMFMSIWANRQLVGQMTRREVVGRYQGSVMGLLWSFITPVVMLLVYTFVFSVVFKAKWGGADEPRSEFAVVLFVGMIVHGLFAEVLNKAPSLITGNVNYVKKIIFPLEIMPAVAMAAALFNTLISISVLLIAIVVLNGGLSWTVVFVPLVIAPLVVLTMGAAWILAALGVYLRDINHSIGILTTVMLFLSPVFFPVTALPEHIQPLMLSNPLTFIIEQARDVLIWGRLPNWLGLAKYVGASLLFAWAGFFFFQKARKGFADVL